MSEKTTNQNPFYLSEEAQKKASEMLEGGARLLTDQMKKLAQELKDFDLEFTKTKARIKNGARRTSGRIV